MNAGWRSAADLVYQTGERTVRIGAFPIGIETQEFSRLARRSVRSPLVRSMVESLAGRALMIGVDRLDYSKGLAQRMDAFERFLALYPDWRSKVTYLQITPKSRSEIREYADMERTDQRSRRPHQRRTMARSPGRRSAMSTAPTAAARWRASIAPRGSGSSRRCATA